MMNKITRVLFICVLIFAAQHMIGCKPSSGDYGLFEINPGSSDKPHIPPLSASVEGTVVVADVAKSGIIVRLYDMEDELRNEMETTSAGNFIFNNVTVGFYKLEAGRGSALYDVATYTMLVNTDGSVFPADIQLALLPKGSSPSAVDVYAAVMDMAENPLADINVELYRGKFADGDLVDSAVTQSLGLFMFFQQQPGEYEIRVFDPADPSRVDIYPVRVKTDGTTTLALSENIIVLRD